MKFQPGDLVRFDPVKHPDGMRNIWRVKEERIVPLMGLFYELEEASPLPGLPTGYSWGYEVDLVLVSRIPERWDQERI